METALKYSVIHNRKQYDKYCKVLEGLVFGNKKNKVIQEEIELLTVLIEKYDAENNPMFKMDGNELLKSFMNDQNAMSQKELAERLDVSEGYVSDMVNGKKNISRQMAVKLGGVFKVRSDAFYSPFQELIDRFSANQKELLTK